MDGKNLACGIESSLAADLSGVERVGAAVVTEIEVLATDVAHGIERHLGFEPGADNSPVPPNTNLPDVGGPEI